MSHMYAKKTNQIRIVIFIYKTETYGSTGPAPAALPPLGSSESSKFVSSLSQLAVLLLLSPVPDPEEEGLFEVWEEDQDMVTYN
jgi:hypothetical protein